MCPRTRDVIAAKIATKMQASKSRDERVVQTLLGCNVKDVPDRLILVSTPYVRKKVSSKLQKSSEKGRLITGRFNRISIGIVDVGIGTPSAALAIEGIVRTSPRALIRVDFCGGLLEEQEVGDSLVANQAIPGDGTANAYCGAEPIQAHAILTQHIIDTARLDGTELHEGIIWTTDTLMLQTIELLQSWKELGACAVDMETSVILGISSQWKIPAASLNCISDRPLHGQGIFEMVKVDPNLLTGLERTINLGLQALISWSEDGD